MNPFQRVVTALVNQLASRKTHALVAAYLAPALTHVPPKWRAVIIAVASGAYILGVALEKIAEVFGVTGGGGPKADQLPPPPPDQALPAEFDVPWGSPPQDYPEGAPNLGQGSTGAGLPVPPAWSSNNPVPAASGRV